MELFVIVILLSVTGVQASQLEGPQNTVSFVGSTAILKCSSSSRNCNGIDWQKYVTGASPMTVFKGPRTIFNTNVIDRDRYSVDNSSGCDLIIRNVNLTDAGRFICSAIIVSSQITKTAHLIVLETQPNCTINASMDDTVEGDGVQLNCIVTYNATKEASIMWKRGTDLQAAVENGTERSCTIIAPETETTKIPEAPTTVANNGTTNKSDSEVTAKETNKTPMPLKTICQSYIAVAPVPEVPSFTCIVSFPVETDANYGVAIVGLATNTLNATCETPIVKVFFSVRNVTLSPSFTTYSPESVINCSAKGHPSPTFKWQEMENGSNWIDIQKGSELIMTNASSNRYRCVAMNAVRGQSYNATSDEIQFKNIENGYASTNWISVHGLANGTDSNVTVYDSTATMYIFVITAAAGILLFIILLIICFCTKSCPGYKCCNSRNKSKDKLRDEQPLTDNPDICGPIYGVVNKGHDIHPKAKSPKRPKGASPHPKASYADVYKHEECTYADLAMEYGPRKVVPQNGQAQEESLYAAVSVA